MPLKGVKKIIVNTQLRSNLKKKYHTNSIQTTYQLYMLLEQTICSALNLTKSYSREIHIIFFLKNSFILDKHQIKMKKITARK